MNMSIQKKQETKKLRKFCQNNEVYNKEANSREINKNKRITPENQHPTEEFQRGLRKQR